jgi:hypothetical protein
MNGKIKRSTDRLHLLYAKLFLFIFLLFIFLTYGIRIEKYAHGTSPFPLTAVIFLLDLIRGIDRDPTIWSIPMYAIEWRAFGNIMILFSGVISLCAFYEFPKTKKVIGLKTLVIGWITISYLLSILLNKLFFY